MTSSRHGADCFDIISFVGSSKNGKVYNVRHKDTGEPLTMHVIPKERQNDVNSLDCSLVVETFRIPYTVNIRYTFQTKSRNYVVLDSVKPERQLQRFFDAYGPFSITDVTFLVSEIVTCVSQLHSHYTTYKQINLENVLLDITGHVKLRRDLKEKTYWTQNECFQCRQNGLCSYHKEATIGQEAAAKDWHDIGILLCFLLTGKFPGKEKGWDAKHRGDQSFFIPSDLPDSAVELTRILLCSRRTPFTTSRILDHEFFANVDWEKARKRQLIPPDIFIKIPSDIKSNSSLPLPTEYRDKFADLTLSEDPIQILGRHYNDGYQPPVDKNDSRNYERGADSSQDSMSISFSNSLTTKLPESNETFQVSENRLFSNEDNYLTDEINFVTAESLEKVFIERKNLLKKKQESRIEKQEVLEMSTNSLSDPGKQDWYYSNSLYSPTYQKQQAMPTYSALYSAFNGHLSNGRARGPLTKREVNTTGSVADINDNIVDQNTLSDTFRHKKGVSLTDNMVESKPDNIYSYAPKRSIDLPLQPMHNGKEDSSLPVFTRSKSYHGGFSDDKHSNSMYPPKAFNEQSPLDRANELLASNFGNWRHRTVDDNIILSHSSECRTDPLAQITPSKENASIPFQNGSRNESFAISKRLSRSLIDVKSICRAQNLTGSPLGFSGNTQCMQQESPERAKFNDEKEEEKFLRDYLTQSLQLEQRCDTEEEVLKKTWPVGPTLYRNDKTRSAILEAGKRNSSLMQKISDHNALQRIREGAYLQRKRDFSLPLKQNLTMLKSEALERSPNRYEEVLGLRSPKMFDDGYSPPIEHGSEPETAMANGTSNVPVRKSVYSEASSSVKNPQYSNSMSASRIPASQQEYSFSGSDDQFIWKGLSTEFPPNFIGNQQSSTGECHSLMSATGTDVGDSHRNWEQREFLEDRYKLPYSAMSDRSAPSRLLDKAADERRTLKDASDTNEKWVSSFSGSERNLENRTASNGCESNGGTYRKDTGSRHDYVEEREIVPEIVDDDVFLENEDFVRNTALGNYLNEPKKRNKKDEMDPVGSKAAAIGTGNDDKEKLNNRTINNSGGSVKRGETKADEAKDRRNKSKKPHSSGTQNETVEPQNEISKHIECNDKSRNKNNGSNSNSRRRHKKLRKMADIRKARKTEKDFKENPSTTDAESRKDDTRKGSRKDSIEENFFENETKDSERKKIDEAKEEHVSIKKKNGSRSVSFHETTKGHHTPEKAPSAKKSQSAGAIDSRRPKLSVNNSKRESDLRIELLPNPKAHRNGHRRLKSVEEHKSANKEKQGKADERKGSLDSSIERISNDDAMGVNDLVDRLRVISESGRSTRSSPTVERRYSLNPNVEIDRTNSVRNILRPKITVENSTPRSNSPVSIASDDSQMRKSSSERNVSRECSIGSASDLWIDEEAITGRRGSRCRRSVSAASGRSSESIELFRAKYAKSPTLLSTSSDDDVNLHRDPDKQSYASGRSIDSGLSDIFETSKEEDSIRPRCNAIAKSDSGVMKDINERRASQSDDVFEDADPSESSRGPESLCHHCQNGFREDNASESCETIQICKKCHTKKVERKEAIVELIQTEINYGQDLRILKEEFYAPIKNGGILSPDNVSAVFLNLQELIDVNSKLCITLQDDLQECITRNDQELESLEVGRVFLENVEFFQAYEVFCSKQGQAADLVEALQKKSELLRIFLQVSCKQNSKLRKMDLKSFLTMPVQRIMKYPLLLTRIYRTTPRGNSDREALIHARRKIEEQITRINEIASGRPAKLRKSKSTSALNQSESKGNQLTRLVAEILDWRLEETQIILSDPLEVSSCELINVSNWSRKSMKKSCKVQAILCAYGVLEQSQALAEAIGGQCGPDARGKCEATNAAMIILRRKSANRYSLHKDPILLSQAVIAQREDVNIAFEVLPILKEPLTFLTEDHFCCQKWLRNLSFYSKDLGLWRARRNAMANIMIPSMS